MTTKSEHYEDEQATTTTSAARNRSFEQKLHNASYLGFVVFLIAVAIEGIRTLAGLPANPVNTFIQLAIIPLVAASAIASARTSRRNKKARASARKQGLEDPVDETFLVHSFFLMPYAVWFEVALLSIGFICHWTSRFTGSPTLEVIGTIGLLLYAGMQLRGISTWLAVRDRDKASG